MPEMIETMVTEDNHLRFLKNIAQDDRLSINLSGYIFDEGSGVGSFLDTPNSLQTVGRDAKTGKPVAFYQTMGTETNAVKTALISQSAVRGMMIGREKTPAGSRDVFLVIPEQIIALLISSSISSSHKLQDIL